MADTIKLPGVGPVKKPVAIAGIGILGGVLVYAYWKRSKTPAAAPAATPTDTTASTTDTGYVQDSTAAGYNTVYPSAYSGGYSQYGYDIYGNPIPAPTGAGSGGVFTTNGDWATAAESALENGNITLSVSTLAISRVLGGLSVTSAQRDLFLQAVGLLGQPPQGYPKPIKLTDSGTGPPTTNPPATNIPTATFVKITHTTSWDGVARSNNVFAGSGRALFEYNLLPGKHQANTYAAVQKSWPNISGKPSWEVDIPKRGYKIQLPVVGVVTS